MARGAHSAMAQLGPYQVHHYSVAGTGAGAPVVLVHGLGGTANGFYKTLFRLRSVFRSVHAIDLPGNGFSPTPASGHVSVRSQVPVLLDYLEQVVRQPALLVGNSLGGAMALYAAAERPGAVAGLSLVSPAGAKVTPERLAALLKTFDVRSSADAKEITRRLFHRAPFALGLVSSQLKYLYGSEAVRAALGELSASDFVAPEILRALSMPTQLLWGQSERLLPYESIEYFRAHLPPHAEIHEVPSFGHVPQVERPAELVAMLRDFAVRHGLSSAAAKASRA